MNTLLRITVSQYHQRAMESLLRFIQEQAWKDSGVKWMTCPNIKHDAMRDFIISFPESFDRDAVENIRRFLTDVIPTDEVFT